MRNNNNDNNTSTVSNTTKIPFVDLEAQYQAIKGEVRDAIDEVLESKAFIQGKYVENFAKNFAEVQGGRLGVGCSNGTSAITLALRTLGVGAGDEVITVANSFIATVEAIHETGARPVLVDCRQDTYGMDMELVEAAIGERTKVIIPVHLYGNPVDMSALEKLAAKYGLWIVEDAAQAVGATIDGRGVGTIGEMGCFSFYPGKNLGAYGDAGMVLMNTDEHQRRVKQWADHGRIAKYENEFLAGNYRMDGIQAAILNIKLKYIKEWNAARAKVAERYDQHLLDAGFKVMSIQPGSNPVYHLYIVEVANRDEVMTHLKSKGIASGIHYPIPLHLQPALKHLDYKLGDFPVAESAAERILSLPIYPELTEGQVDRVLASFLERGKNS